MSGWLAALMSALLLAAVSTIGDFLWARFVTEHRTAYGLLHGIVVCLAIGFALGVHRRRPLAGALAGAVVGLAAAASFYGLAPWLGYSAMFVAWMGLWVGFGLISGSAIRSSVARGVAAAVLSGAAFYAISGIWTRPGPGAPDYLYHYLCWTVAFLPGFLALLVRAASSSDDDSRSQSSAV